MAEPAAVAKIPITFTLNGEAVQVRVWPMQRLLDVLREDLRLTGSKEGCGEGECGACSVFLDGRLVNSCLVPIVQVAGCAVTTIEGVTADPGYDGLRRAFVECNAAQCGICTPGMFLAAIDLLRACPRPSDDQIREHLSGNLCRCTGYVKILDAVKRAAGPGGAGGPA